ncbi:MAG: porphobilinogen synthase [Planctomycetes bacterium]|jgi:porphobilinogen synthase|nr:porphobilinogen synthase [Planctomycetota bacterium]
MGFPEIRMRRLRRSATMRRMVRETTLRVDDLIYPLFVRAGQGLKQSIPSMTDCYHFSPDRIAEETARVADLGIPAVLLFGLPAHKDETGSEAWAEDGVVQQAIRQIKKRAPDLLVVTDVCLCEYTSTGHCGVIRNGNVENDATLELLAKMALSHAQAGADIVAPSDMMDGRVRAIRQVLECNGFDGVAILSYAAKFASAFYGPFRDAAESAPAFGDRKSYQMDPANTREALREIELDLEEGADLVMVKPALSYLDIIRRARERFDCPIAAYNVSGEYMMLNAAADAGLLDRDAGMMEMLTSIKRAGADVVLTYFAKRAAELLRRRA